MWRRKWQPTPVHFPGKNPRMEEPDRLPRVGHDWATSLYFTLLSHIQHIHQKAKVKNLDVLSRFGCVQLFVTLMGCNPPGSSVRGILQARILEWVAISFSRGSSDPGIEPASPVSPSLQVCSLPLSHVKQPEQAAAPHSSALAWKVPWTEEPGRLQSTWS